MAAGIDGELLGRAPECETLDRLLAAVRAGESRALVVRGEAGVGKTALLEYLVDRAVGFRVARVSGVQSEMELVFAGLHQLCLPMLDRLGGLPGPQRDALRTAFGLHVGASPDRFFVGLAVLGLLSEVAAERPLLCVVDDAQWLDRASALALAFVARRLSAESVAAVFAVRGPPAEQGLAALPELRLEGLAVDAARALLGSVVRGPLDVRVRDRILDETGGNPLALLELPRGWSVAEMAGGFGLPGASGLSGRIEDSFARRLTELGEEARRVLLVAAAEPTGDPLLVWRAAGALGIGRGAATSAAQAGLVEIGSRVRFRHPLVRSAVYRAADAGDRRAAHRALAEVTDPESDPERRAWHRAEATAGPDDDVAAELERSAGRAQSRGGLAAAAAFLERAAKLSSQPAMRATRAMTAAEAKHQAGAPDAALVLLGMAESGPLDELQAARGQLLRGRIVFAASGGRNTEAPKLLLDAARRLEPIDVELSRNTYLDALGAIVLAGEAPGCTELDVAVAARRAPRPPQPRAADLLLDALALLITEGHAAAVPTLRRALHAFMNDVVSMYQGLGWGLLAGLMGTNLREHEAQAAIAVRSVQFAREAGALAALSTALPLLAGVELRDGDLAAAAALMAEADAVYEAMGGEPHALNALTVAAYRGREAETTALMEAAAAHAGASGFRRFVILWAGALLYNGLGRHTDALALSREATERRQPIGTVAWVLPELIEAAVRVGARQTAVDALGPLSKMSQAAGTDWALALEARSRALLSDGEDAERLYREAIDRLSTPGNRVELARAHLIYGEWLRRERRRTDARDQLRHAHRMFEQMGLEAFTERAARELLATGEAARKRTIPATDGLTAQEHQIARLARDGLSNPEIGARLLISPRTVQYHLHKVFAKLGVTSRSQLQRSLPREPP